MRDRSDLQIRLRIAFILGTVVLIFSTRSRPASAIVSKTNTTIPNYSKVRSYY